LVAKRVNDRRMLRLLDEWLRAGVLEGGVKPLLSRTVSGVADIAPDSVVVAERQWREPIA